MPYDFYKYLQDSENPRELKNMPPITISSRSTDKWFTY